MPEGYISREEAGIIFRRIFNTELEMLKDMRALVSADKHGEITPEYILDQLILGKRDILTNIEEYIV